jgi:hypothetical protein
MKGRDNHQRSRVGRHDITDGPSRSVTSLPFSVLLRHPAVASLWRGCVLAGAP